MGERRARLKIHKPDGEFVELEALVGTGATFTRVSREKADSLGLKAWHATELELAEGRRAKRGLTLVGLELEG